MAEQLAFHKKRRTIVRSSLTKLSTNLTELEARPHDPTLLESAKNLAEKLKSLEQEFKNHQLSIIDRFEDENLMEEQESLEENNDIVSGYSIRIQRLITAATPSTMPDTVRMVTKQLALLHAKVESISETIRTLDDEEDLVYTLEEYRDQMIEIKVELTQLNTSLLTSEAAFEDAVMRDLTKTVRTVFTCIIAIKKRLRSINAAMLSESSVTKLPKLGLPTFHGDILQWKNFCVSVHERTTFPKEEKLIYLQNAIKDKTAKNIVAGLTKSNDNYDKAIKINVSRRDTIALVKFIRHTSVTSLKSLPSEMVQVKKFVRFTIW